MTDILERLSAAIADRYRIERELGQGGMATVYLAEDLKHDRKVAIKVLQPELAAVLGGDRFLSEIKTTAKLQHPHILPLLDSGSADGLLYYVMPLVTGETLRDRLTRERQLPIDDALRIAGEAADALQYAHASGIIHRDIKPENILLQGGHALVADFGIALAVQSAGGSRMTQTGLSLGTPQYMSPEQAMGERTIDARSDIYALGAVTYEMLTGDPPFTGSSIQAIVAKVITEKPQPMVAQRARVQAHVEDAVLTALEKLPADRFASAAAFASALAGREPVSRRTAQPPRGAATSRQAAFIAAATLIGVAAGAGAGWIARGSPDDTAVQQIRFATAFGRPDIDQPYLSISPDGRKILRNETDTNGVVRVIMHDLGSNTISAIAGTENASNPEFSTDGQWIAFVATNKLQKVPAAGGPVTTLIDSVTVDDGVAWTAAGDLIFSIRGSGLWRLPASGGSPVELTHLDSARKDFGHWYPRMLPGDRAMIYVAYAERSRIEVYDFKSGRRKILVEDAVFPRYSRTGHLLYARDAAVYAVAFDPQRLEVSGEAVPVQDDVAWEKTNALAAYDIAPNGTLVFLRNSEWGTERELIWRDRMGRATPVLDRAGPFAEPRVSPDGRFIAFTMTQPKLELYLYEIGRRSLSQLSRAPAAAFNANWLDNRRVVYTYEAPVYDVHVLTTDASAADRVVIASALDKLVTSVSPDGRRVLYMQYANVARQLVVASIDGDPRPTVLTQAGGDQRFGVFSPDNRWIAYTEFVENRADVYIRSSDGGGGRRLVSAGGGTEPRWTKGGREIVYIKGSAMMSVAVDPASGDVSTPVMLFGISDMVRSRQKLTHAYDVTPDGSRFLFARRIDRPAARPLNVVLNWRPGPVPLNPKSR